MQLSRNIGVIAPNQIESEMLILKSSSRVKSNRLMLDAINLYEGNNGRIRPFDLNITRNSTGSPIDRSIPFFMGKAPMSSSYNETKQSGNQSNYIPVMFVNMYGLGTWNDDATRYSVNSIQTDFASALEGACLAYNLNWNNGEKIFDNPKITITLTRIYTYLFKNALYSVVQLPPKSTDDELTSDELAYHVSKFFIKYCLQKNDDKYIDDVAYSAIRSKFPLSSILDMAKYRGINYDTLSGFLASIGKEMFGDEITLIQFVSKWQKLYGGGMSYAIEYIPYLLFFLIALINNSTMGHTSSLINRRSALISEGLNILYREILATISSLK
jgi:hypothetical protein